MRINRAVALVCVALAVVLTACGGGSSGSGSTDSTGSPPSPLGAPATGSGPKASGPGEDSGAGSATPSGPGGSSGSPSSPSSGSGSGPGPAPSHSAGEGEPPARGGKRSPRGGARRRARGAAAFLVPQGDNSIPTYGAESSPSELTAATESLGAYLAARADRDWARACSYLGAPVQKQLDLLAGGAGGGDEGCAPSYAKLSSRVGASQLASPLAGALAAFRVEGDKAFALFYGPGEQQYMMPMVSEGGVWNANQLEPIPWPIGSAGPPSP